MRLKEGGVNPLDTLPHWGSQVYVLESACVSLCEAE